MPTTTAKPPPRKSSIILYVVRTIRVPREQVWRAWTDPKELRRWFGPEDGYSLPAVEIDLKKGGYFRFGMKPPNPAEDPYFVTGTYRDVKPGQWLVFTWEWEGERTWSAEAQKTQPPPTMVTVAFREREEGAATEVFLTHDGFRDEKDREDHRWGWNGCFDRLAALI